MKDVRRSFPLHELLQQVLTLVLKAERQSNGERNKPGEGHGPKNQAMHPQPVSELLHYMPKPDRYSLVRNLFAASSFVMRMLGPS